MTMAETQVESGASGSAGGGASCGTGGGGGVGPPDAVAAAPLLHLHANNNHPLATNNNHHRATAKRKRKRLSQVVDKLATQVSSGPAAALPPLNNNFHHHNHNHKELDLLKLVKTEPEDDALAEEAPEPRALKASKTLAAAVVAAAAAAAAAAAGAGVGRGPVEGTVPPKEEPAADVFRFDSTDRERYLFNAISEEDETEDVFSPASSSNKSPHSSNTDSPKISFSPLRLKDSSVEDELDGAASCTPPSSGRSAGGSSGGAVTAAAARGPHGPGEDAPRYPGCACAHCASASDRFFPASPISPLTPVSPSPAPIYHFEQYLHTKYLPDIFRRRSHSDSDLPMWFEGAKAEGSTEAGATQAAAAAAAAGGRARHPPQPLKLPAKGGSLESETSTPQDSPLDLSMKGSRERVGSSTSSESVPPGTPGFDPVAAAAAGVNPAALQLQLLTPGFLPPGKTGAAMPVPVVKGDVASPTTKESVAVRYNLEVSPVVEEMPPGSDVAYVCPVCGQMFSLHDRLAKHMASRHKSRAQQPDQTSKAYLCEICKRSFARSDMLTRHMRLHTGVKPYTCRICGQVFSRSDHLSTHQRTHTGEKPYRCPQCPYAACRRDMITRHMRTHARYEPGAERPERGRRGRRGGRGRGRGRGDASAGPPPPAEAKPEMTDPGVGLDDMGDLPLSDDLLPPDCISPEPPLSPAQALVGGLAVVVPMDTGGHDGD